MSSGATTWADLDGELSRWRRAGRSATLWWRDDDATAPDAALERLARLSARWSVPLSVAVIPHGAPASLEGVLAIAHGAVALQHGFAHADHARPDEPSAELGVHRPAAAVLAELEAGRAHLARTLGERFVPVLVPPWNRIAVALVPSLRGLGFTGLSCFAPRAGAERDGLRIVNCHVDPVHWRGGGAFRGEARTLSSLVAHLRDRRTGAADADEPTGLLTHHWRHDHDLWSFLERLFERLHARAEARWLDARAVFPA